MAERTPILDMDVVKAHLQITHDSMYDIDILTRACLNAEEFLGKRLRTPLREGSYQETFFTNRKDCVFDLKTLQLQTHAGFLRDVKVERHTALQSDKVEVQATLVDKEAGILTLEAHNPESFFTVTYTAGYKAGDELPIWLETALLISLSIVYNMPSNGVEARGSDNSTTLLDNNILDKIRVNGLTVKAISHVRN